MKNLFSLVICIILFSCQNAANEKSASIDESAAQVVTVEADSVSAAPAVNLPKKATSSKAFNVSDDSKSLKEKEAKMSAESFSKAEWRDTACGQCGARCCVSCTSGGNPGQCAETRFKNCSSCGHASASHYSASH